MEKLKKEQKPIPAEGAAVLAAASVVGHKEFEGPLGPQFDVHDMSDMFGEETFEKAESEMQREALSALLGMAHLSATEIDAVFAGDLLNQCVGSAYGLSEFEIPYFGLYGACSTAAEGLLLSSLLVSRGAAERTAVVTSSHNAAAERQYRNPLEYGGQRSPTAQWTVTGAGAFLIGHAQGKRLADVAEVFPGRIVDRGVTDLANMGAVMAPAACDTLLRYFAATGLRPDDFDLIVTGDLGFEGISILGELLEISGVHVGERLSDCGVMLYDRERQDVHAGGSGCGCSAIVMAAHILPMLQRNELKNVLFLGTGAMMSPASTRQGLAIPAIAHLVRLRSPDGGGKGEA